MELTVNWQPATSESESDMFFVAHTESGHRVAMDGAPANETLGFGGKKLAPRPMEMVLLGTGGCTAYDVVLILRRSRQKVKNCQVTLKAERAATDPKVFTHIHFHFVVTGENLKKELVERAIDLSHNKYCSASIMLAKTAAMSHSFEVVDL